ncbi:Maf family protein [Halopseudomonas xiamenensis]|uniref:Maf family protein n=1 Tax=Halopseudomonas xiamenensis TaxID=157792 RepID=UPI001625D2BB|nr:Maf family protein [Halopseudomonas xiamenensis]
MCSEQTLYLASASPRRRELLEQIGVPLQVVSCAVDEQVLAGEAAMDYVQRVTRDKVRAGVEQAPAGAVVLAADTAVVLDGRILGKPVDREQGLAMLRALSAREHSVITVVAVARGRDVRLRPVVTQVRFRALSEAEISAYWDTGEPADKAGGYGIQGLGAVFVAHIAGSYSAVVGLPLMETAELLAEFAMACWQPR